MLNNKSDHIVAYILSFLSVVLLCVLLFSHSALPPTSSKPTQALNTVLEAPSFEPLGNAITECQCSAKNITATTTTATTFKDNAVLFGEELPVLVPDFMPAIPKDILDKINLNRNKKENHILVTIAGYAMRDYVYNWIHLLKETRKSNKNINEDNDNEEEEEEEELETKFIIFCTDPKLYVHLIVAGYESNAVLIPDEWLLSSFSEIRDTSSSFEGSKRYSHVTSWVLQRLMYDINVNILMMDVDVIFVQHQQEFMSTLMKIRPDTHLVIAQSTLDQRTVDPGVMLIRANSRHVKRVLARTIQLQQHYDNSNEEIDFPQAFNKALASKELHVKQGMMVLLDVMHFSNQEAYFDRQLPRKLGITPYVVHPSNKKLGDEKKEMLKENDFWVVDQNQLDSLNQQVDTIWSRRMIHQ